MGRYGVGLANMQFMHGPSCLLRTDPEQTHGVKVGRQLDLVDIAVVLKRLVQVDAVPDRMNRMNFPKHLSIGFGTSFSKRRNGYLKVEKGGPLVTRITCSAEVWRVKDAEPGST